MRRVIRFLKLIENGQPIKPLGKLFVRFWWMEQPVREPIIYGLKARCGTVMEAHLDRSRTESGCLDPVQVKPTGEIDGDINAILRYLTREFCVALRGCVPPMIGNVLKKGGLLIRCFYICIKGNLHVSPVVMPQKG